MEVLIKFMMRKDEMSENAETIRDCIYETTKTIE